jgi:ribonuclease R
MPAYPTMGDRILGLLGLPDYTPLTAQEIASKLKMPHQVREQVGEKLIVLEQQGAVARVRKDRWIVPTQADLVTGVAQFNQKGFAFVIPEDGSADVYVTAEDTGTAMHQDLVTVRLIPDSPNDRRERRPGSGDGPRRRGKIIRVLKRRHETLVGVLQKSGLFHLVVPDDPRYAHDIYVKLPESDEASKLHVELGDKVVVRLLEWVSRHHNPEGVLVERLGRPGDPGVDILSIIRKHELPVEFPSDVLAELARFSKNDPAGNAPIGDAFLMTLDEFLERERQKKQWKADPNHPDQVPRVDLREEFVITIDPDTAKDFDDAISLHPLPNGNFIAGIHIADVSHYVVPGSALDTEARSRGNSVYLVNQVIPMLPEELSNGLCSLIQGVDRLTFSAFVELTPDGKVIRSHFSKGIIRSRNRLTYAQAFERLQRPPFDALDQLLHQFWGIASQLRKARMENGSLDLDFPEVKVICDENGRPIRLDKIENDISHQLIEEFMLLANEEVAAFLKMRHAPALYRVHENPDPEKLQAFRMTLKEHGLKVGDVTQREELKKALVKINESMEKHSLKIALLKSLKRATYSPKPLGHFGLAKTNYTHFTSPIRRYADLIIHRAIGRTLGISSEASMPPLLREKAAAEWHGDQLEKTAKHISDQERVAADAEIESVRLKKLEFFALQLTPGDVAGKDESAAARHEATSFKAMITDIQNFGMFVELPDFLISGLVHVSTLQDDFYVFDPMRQIFQGRRHKRTFRTGDSVMVQVDKIDMAKRQIDFRMAPEAGRPVPQERERAPRSSHSEREPRTSRPDREHRAPQQDRGPRPARQSREQSSSRSPKEKQPRSHEQEWRPSQKKDPHAPRSSGGRSQQSGESRPPRGDQKGPRRSQESSGRGSQGGQGRGNQGRSQQGPGRGSEGRPSQGGSSGGGLRQPRRGRR